MAEKQQQVYPLAPVTNGVARSDSETATSQGDKDLKKKKRIKIAIYVAIFVVFQIAVITVFGAVIMRANSPKIRLSKDFVFQKLDVVSTSSQASFDMSFTTQVRIKNPNFGPYKFGNSTVTFSHNGVAIGQVVVPRGKAGMKGTRKVNIAVNLDSRNLTENANLGAELTGRTLTLTSSARVTGKVELMWIMKKKQAGNMNCTLVIDVSAKNLKSLECK